MIYYSGILGDHGLVSPPSLPSRLLISNFGQPSYTTGHESQVTQMQSHLSGTIKLAWPVLGLLVGVFQPWRPTCEMGEKEGGSMAKASENNFRFTQHQKNFAVIV